MLARFAPVHPLRSGNHGVVWTGHTPGGAPCAIKVMPKTRHDINAQLNKRIIANELEHLQLLHAERARHVVDLWDVLEDADAYYVVQEQCVPLQYGGFPLNRLLTDIGRGLAECHGLGIIHGDVKPDNLVYSPTSDAYKLVDLGSSLRVTPTKPVGYLRWTTMAFAPPELIAGRGAVTTAADMWSLGITAVELSKQTAPTLNSMRLVGACLVAKPHQRCTAVEAVRVMQESPPTDAP